MIVTPDPKLQTVGARARFERMRLGKSQVEIARLSGISTKALVAFERGTGALPQVIFEVLCEYQADLTFILTGHPGNMTAAKPSALHRALSEHTVRSQLSLLHPVDRRRLLLDLLAEELRG